MVHVAQDHKRHKKSKHRDGSFERKEKKHKSRKRWECGAVLACRHLHTTILHVPAFTSQFCRSPLLAT